MTRSSPSVLPRSDHGSHPKSIARPVRSVYALIAKCALPRASVAWSSDLSGGRFEHQSSAPRFRLSKSFLWRRRLLRPSLVLMSGVFHTYPALAQPISAESVVEAHIDAMNRHDLDAYMATYAPDAKIYSYAQHGPPLYSGREEIRRRFAEVMKIKGQSHVVSRSVMDNKYVVDREITYHVGAARFFDGICIYTIADGLIEREEFVGDGDPVTLLP